MKPHAGKLRKAATKMLRKSRTGPADEQDLPAPKRLMIRAPTPAPRLEPPPAPEIDLTADTPPEGSVTNRPWGEPQVATEASPATAEREAETTGLVAGPSSPPRETLENSSPRPEPERTEVAEGDRVEPTPRGFSLMNDGRRAERLISQIALPEFLGELRQLGASRFFREAFSAVLRVSTSLVATREVIEEADAAVHQARQDAEEAQARAEAAEKALGATAKALDVAEKALGTAKETLEAARDDHAVETKEAAARLEIESSRLRAALNQLGETESRLAARDLHIDELKSMVRAAEAKAEGEAKRAHEVDAAAEARVTAAVEEYKASELFADELVAATAGAYAQGFQEAREKVARVLDVPQARDIEPDQESEGASPGDEPAADS